MRVILFSTYVGVVTILGVLAADFLYTRLVLKDRMELEWGIELGYRIPNEDYGYGLKQNYSGPGSVGGRAYEVYTNSLGFRDSEVRSIDKTADKPRIVFIGDSFTEGYGVNWGETFVGVVAERRKDLEILNAGVVSYSQRIYFQKIRWLIESGYEFDHLILFMDISDIHDEAIRAREETNDGGPRRMGGAGGENITEDTQLDESAQDESGAYDRIKTIIRENLFLTRAGLRAGRRYLGHVYAYLGGDPRSFMPGPASLGQPRGSWTITGDDPTAFAPLGLSGSIDEATKWMDRLYSLLKDHDIPLTVAVYPWPNQIEHDDLNSMHVMIWRSWCADKCAGFIDLFPAVFEEAKVHGNLWYDALFIDDDIHFNARGNQILADGALQYLDQILTSR